MLDALRLSSVGSQLMSADEVVVEGKRFGGSREFRS
jgi:hypothetical protein